MPENKSARAKTAPVRMIVANLDKDKPGDAAYRRGLRDLYLAPALAQGRDAVLFQTEAGHGPMSTQLTPVGIPMRDLPHLIVGETGVHNGVARGRIRIDGHPARLFCVHGLHRKTTSGAAQDRYYAILAARFRRLNDRGISWVVGGDFNRNPYQVAQMLGGRVGVRADVMGLITSLDLIAIDSGVGTHGKKHGFTDHAEIYADITAKAAIR